MYRIINLGRRRRRRRSLLLLLFIFCPCVCKTPFILSKCWSTKTKVFEILLICFFVVSRHLLSTKKFFHQKSQKRAIDTEKPIARSLALGKEERGAKRGARPRWHLHRRRHRSVALAASHRCRRVYRERAMVLREEDNEEEEASSDGD